MVTRYDSMLNKARDLIASADFKTDTSKMHLEKMMRLRAVVGRIDELIAVMENRSKLEQFIAKFIDKEEKEFNEKVAECALLVNRLTACKSCVCLSCKKASECRYSCKICPESSGIVYCDQIFAVRQCNGWIITPQKSGVQIKYNVLFMVTCLSNGKHYLLLENRVDLGRGICTYDRNSQNIKPADIRDMEVAQVRELLNKVQGMLS